MFTRTDFTTCWGIMIVIMVELVMFMILIFAFRYEVLSSLYCTLGVILFGVYLVIDTQLIIGGRRYELSMDDYVLGALVLYCDIIQIFLFLLRMMGRR
jgi:FtsH-binding integral membrane protein